MSRSSRLVAALCAGVLTSGLVVGAAGAASAAAPATAPVLDTPTYAQEGHGNPVFSWEAVPGAEKSPVQISKSSSFSSNVYDVVTFARHATPGSDLPLGPLYWRVSAQDHDGAAGPWQNAQFVQDAVD